MPIDEIINDGTNMVVGAAQGAVADQQPETIVVTADPNLEQPLDIEQLSPQKAKDVNWYNKAIDVFNLEKGTKLPKVADAVEIADDDYMAVTKHFNDRVVNDYNTTNDKLKLGLPLVTDISEIKPENSQKIDEAKVVSHINKANKELKMAQDVLGGELLKFEPFRSLDDMRNRADDFMAKLEKATNAKDKNKLLSDVNKYITNANKESGLNVPLFSNADDAKKAITVGKDGVAPLAKKFEDLSSTKAVGDELKKDLLGGTPNDMLEYKQNKAIKDRAEKERIDFEKAQKRSADIAILSKKAQKDGTPFLESTYLKFLNNGATQYASQAEADAEVVRLSTENPNIKGFGVRQFSDEYGNTKWQVSVAEEVDAQYYKDAQNITAEGALIKQKQANALMPEYKALKEEINRYTMQGIAVPPQILAKYDDVSSTIQDYLTASNILTDVASENYVKYNNLESKRGGLLSAITFDGVESFNRITEGIMTLGLTIPELMMLPIPSNVAENTDFMKATQKGKQNVGEFFEKRTRYLQDVFGIAPQYRGGAVTEAVSGAVGILPYILGGELAVPFMVATGVDANLKALEGEKGLSTNEKNLIALVKGSIGAYVMSKGLDVIGGHTAINRIAYNTMKNLPVNFTGKTLQNLVGKEVTQYISNTAATSGSFGILNPASGVADIGITELAKVATDGRFNPQASHDVLKDLAESFVHGLGTGVVLGGVTGSLKLGADKISNEREFRQMDAMVQDPSLIPILKLKLGQQVVDKKISADEYKKAIANINSVANIASQIPKDFSNSSRYQSFKLLKENAEYEKQKAGLAPVYIKRIDGLIEANNAELIKIADNESVKSIPNDTQNPETTNSESTTTDGTNEVTTQETKVMDDGVKVENDVVSLADKIRKLKTQKGALNSDITFGLRNYAIEEIAQLVEDGIEVAKAIGKVLSDKRYKDLNKDEIEKAIYGLNHTEVVNGFYSSLEKTINESKLEKLPAKQWAEKFKGEEAKWTGLTEWLSQQTGSVSKADIQKFLKDNRVEIVEVVKGEVRNFTKDYITDVKINQHGSGYWVVKTKADDTIEFPVDKADDKAEAIEYALEQLNYDNYSKRESKPKFSQYQLEGQKENYKEVLVTMPSRNDNLSEKEYEEFRKIDDKIYYNRTPEEQRKYVEYQNRFTKSRVANKDFKSSHFDEPNILVHLRINTRTDSEGNKVLFIEEVQSDWGQKGKKEGFKDDVKQKEWDKLEAERQKLWEEVNEMHKGQIVPPLLQQKINEVVKKQQALYEGLQIPQAPFVTDTNAWTKLGLKVALKEAVNQGVDKIAWTTGEQQNDRYDLSKQATKIAYNKQTQTLGVWRADNGGLDTMKVPQEKLADYVGKELADKINSDSSNYREYEGENLQVGGKGMKGFYGSPTEGSLGIVGNVAKSLFKQEPKITNLKSSKNSAEADKLIQFMDRMTEKYGEAGWVAKLNDAEKREYQEAAIFKIPKQLLPQHSIDITPELKKQVEIGQSLFDKNTETKTLADKVRALKSKGTLQTDFTLGLKDLALEEIAQLIEDGTVVIEAIKKVLANSKYASLNKDEIRNLVFSVNPLTEKDFERNDSEKVVDRNKRLEADLKQRGYTQNEIDYILRGGVDRIEKVDTVREETKVVDNLNKILKSVQAKAKDMPLKEAVDKAIEQVQGEWVKGKEIILENAIRKFKKEHEIAVTNPTDRAVKPKPIMITVDEKKALTDQIKLEVKAATEGAKSITDGFKEVAKIVNEILKQHKTTISTRQLNAIQKRMAYLKVGSNESVRKYVDYIEKVLANAEYADQLASVKSTNKKLKKALKNDKIPASVRATANDFIKLDPADVENLNKHEAYANELLEAMKSGGIKVQDGNVIDKTRKAADLSKIDNYIEKEMVLAEKRAEQSMNEEYQTTTEAEDNTDEIKAYVQRKFDNMKAMVGRMLERGVDMDGNPIDFTPEEVSMIKKVMGMKLDQLDNIKDWYEATEALDHLLTNGDLGLIPHILNKYQNAVTVNKGTQTLINKMAGNISLLPITKFFAQMEKLVTTTIPFGKRNPKDSYGTKIFFDNSSFRRWDNLVKNFKDYGIYESTFYHLAKAYANYKTLVRQMDAQRISKELFASNGYDQKILNGYDQKILLESKFKITAFLRQLEFESNPESKTNKPAIDYLNATIEAAENLNHPIQGEALDMLKDVVSKHTVDGQISLESLRNSFTQGEKKAIVDLQKTYKALAPYHNKVSLAIRNKAFTAIENYSHISAYSKDNIVLTPSATKREYMNVLKGTKSGTIEERTGAASAINLDPFSTANKAVRDVMLDYFMTNPFRNVEKILDNFAKYSIEELKKYPRGTAEYENALKRRNIADAWQDIYSDARENMLGRSYFETNPFKEFMQLAAKRAVEFTLGKPDRLLAELFSNMGFVMSSATKEFALGSTKYLKYNGGEIQAKIMENVQSSATERLHPHGGIATSVMDTQDFDIAVADDQNISSPVRRKALQFYYNTLAKGIGTGQMINEGMITSGDLLIARPIWTGTMATEFKKITGKDIDFDKIAENDIEYMDANEEAIDKARTVADRKVTDAAASKNPFETAPKMSNRSTQILQALNTYMRGFNMNEYELASDALMHLVKGGKMSAKDATRILSGISARAGLYKAVQAKAATAMMAAIMGGWAMLQNDEKKTEVDKLIGNMGDDTPENRRKVAAKLLELFATSNPNIPELAGMGEVGDALKTTDEETVKFWKRAAEEPNTFIEDVVKGIGQQYLSLLTQRNFGNIVHGFLTAPLFEEYVNKKLRDDYDPYKDSYLYGKLPDTGKKNWLIRSIEANLGAYGLPLAMLMDITVAGIELRTNIKKLDAENEELKKHIDKVPLEKNKLEDWYDLKDRQKSLEKKIEDSYKSIAKEVAIAAGMGTGAIPALKNIDKAMDKIMQDAYKLPKDWKKIQEKIEAIKNGVSPEDIMNAENKQKAVSEIYDVIEPGEKMPDKYDDAIKKVLEK